MKEGLNEVKGMRGMDVAGLFFLYDDVVYIISPSDILPRNGQDPSGNGKESVVFVLPNPVCGTHVNDCTR